MTTVDSASQLLWVKNLAQSLVFHAIVPGLRTWFHWTWPCTTWSHWAWPCGRCMTLPRCLTWSGRRQNGGLSTLEWKLVLVLLGLRVSMWFKVKTGTNLTTNETTSEITSWKSIHCPYNSEITATKLKLLNLPLDKFLLPTHPAPGDYLSQQHDWKLKHIKNFIMLHLAWCTLIRLGNWLFESTGTPRGV